MVLRSIALACGVIIGAATAANAACVVNNPQWPQRNVNGAQNLARNSDFRRVRTAYVNGTCTITSLVHRSGRPCPATNNNNHSTVTVVGVNGAYHVFTIRVHGGRFCTTH